MNESYNKNMSVCSSCPLVRCCVNGMYCTKLERYVEGATAFMCE